MKHPIQEFLLNDDLSPRLTQGSPKGLSKDMLFPTVCNMRKGRGHTIVSYSTVKGSVVL